jgi:hypothetical protein
MPKLLLFNAIQIRDNIDGRLGFIDRPSAWMKKSPATFNEFEMAKIPYAVTADEYVEAMIFIHEKNYSLVKCVSYDTLCDMNNKWKNDFYKC